MRTRIGTILIAFVALAVGAAELLPAFDWDAVPVQDIAVPKNLFRI